MLLGQPVLCLSLSYVWSSTATDRPDYGYDGLRDLRDIEFFGEIHSYFNSTNTKQYFYPEFVMQRLAFINVLCESIACSDTTAI